MPLPKHIDIIREEVERKKEILIKQLRNFSPFLVNDFDKTDEEDWKYWEVSSRISLLTDAFISLLDPTKS